MGFADGMKALGRALKPFGGTLAKVAASAVPGGAVAANLLDTVRDAVGSASTDPEELANAVAQADPETAARIRAADQKHALEMRKIALETYQTDQRDRASARQMQIKTKNPALIWLGTGIIASGVLVIAYFGTLLASGREISDFGQYFLTSALSYIMAAVMTVVAFYYGSSHGAETIHESMSDRLDGRK